MKASLIYLMLLECGTTSFWLDHRCNEDSTDDGSRVKSHSNQWEVDMATALVQHLVRQGEYKSTEIALLTDPLCRADAKAQDIP